MKKILIFSTILLSTTLLLTGCGKTEPDTNEDKDNVEEVNQGNVTITFEEYSEIELGISYDDLKKIVGGECSLLEDEANKKYICSGIMAGTNATFTFEDDKLIDRTQTGLE